MALLLSCLANVFKLGNHHAATLTEPQCGDSSPTPVWSTAFICLLNKTYLMALYTYLMEKNQS